MPDDSSRALTLRRLTHGLSLVPSKKPSPKNPSPKTAASDPDASPYHGKNKAVWKEVKRTDGNSSALILAVVSSDEKKPMSKLIDEKKHKGKLKSTVVVTTPKHLQEKIESTVNKKYGTLYLFVSSTIEYIAYNIAGVINRVHVTPCGSSGRQTALRIGGLSTYAGFKTYAWDRRTGPELLKKQITHAEGCVFDIREDIVEARQLLSRPVEQVDLTEAEKAEIKRQFATFRDEVMDGPPEASGNSGRPVSADSNDFSAPDAYEGDSWFQRSKGLIATVIGAGTAIASMGGAFWFSAGGVCLKGPLGFSLAAGYVNVAAAGGAMAVGGATGLIVGGAVYLIPWETLWSSMKKKLWAIWDYIWDVLVWVWDKLKGWVSGVASSLSGASSAAPRPAQFSH